MEVRYPMHIEEDLDDVMELIEVNENLLSEHPDDTLKYNLKYLNQFKSELDEELNKSHERYMLASFDTIIESDVKDQSPSVEQSFRYLSNLQKTIYALAESALHKVNKYAKISDMVFTGATMGVGRASKGSLRIQLNQIDHQTSFQPYIRIATDKLNELLECGSDEDLLKEQAMKLGYQPISRYKALLDGINKDKLTVKLFDKIKPEEYESRIITPEFAETVFTAIVQAEPKKEVYREEIEGELVTIDGRSDKIIISTFDGKNKKDIPISFDNERFGSLIGNKYKKQIKVEVEITEFYHELEADTLDEIVFKRFI
jgi:hypothetical protein